ncbi:transporter substrate-binding domain-containing protein [Pseudomonas sp. LBUM920]|jgi:lysine/arginine/ornithine transport system substrate-binding protein|uniref:transporter substrate-binding domain-containing protein n=1 Tax=Pseudomonas sp. LBUM920 TaxID=2126069 RepID=UPI000F6EB6C8|nr:transporter substrate-binding domain-containing protein [Pseudomonas sp. LBUM920]AZF61990.1 RidA superfamily protein [Pseudomonas sp. LBUM920]
MTTTRRILALALMMLAGSGCAVAPPPVNPWSEIRFGVEADVPPFEYRNEQGELVGLDIELGNALCAELNARCVWVDQPYATNLAALQAGRFDAIMPMTATPPRRETVDFTHPLYALESRLVAPTGSSLLPTPDSLRGKRVGVLTGTSRAAFALARWAPKGVQVRQFNLNAELIKALKAGELDATLQDTVEITQALLNTPQGKAFAFAGPVINDELLGSGPAIAVRKTDPQLTAALNKALQRLKDSGKYAAITQPYLAPAAAESASARMIYTPAQGGFPYSEVVQVGHTLYLAGVLGLDENGKLVRGGIRAETAQALENLRGTLKTKGLAMDRVAKCTVILADVKDFPAMNEVYARYFPAGRLPARTTFAAGKLLLNARIEIECIASL